MSNPIKNFYRAPACLRALAADRTGGAAVMLALGLSSVIGLAGLGTEVAAWYTIKQTMQGAADAAAFTAITAKTAGVTSAQFTTQIGDRPSVQGIQSRQTGVVVKYFAFLREILRRGWLLYKKVGLNRSK